MARHACAIGVWFLVAALAIADSADARPKRYTFRNACTGDQVLALGDNPGVQDCIAKGNQDIIDGKTHYHYVACLPGGGVSCCQDLNDTGARSCDPISTRAIPPQPVRPLQSAPLTTP
jgi:hypothetical protein